MAGARQPMDLTYDELNRIADALREHKDDPYWGSDENLIQRIEDRMREMKRADALEKISRLDAYYSGLDGVTRI